MGLESTTSSIEVEMLSLAPLGRTHLEIGGILVFNHIILEHLHQNCRVALAGFDPATYGLWAHHASAAPKCSFQYLLVFEFIYFIVGVDWD
jgi:hypothetical protein